MLTRACLPVLRSRLASFPVVALLGPRQVGKTTLAFQLAEALDRPTTYLDLERPSDASKLASPELYLDSHRGGLVILDEVQRQPELFQVLRSLVDERGRGGEPTGHFLVLGSASRDLLRQSSETLAGRIAYLELRPFALEEVAASEGGADVQERLWLRGGFPRSFLARTDQESWDWRASFAATFLERDLPQLGLRLPAVQLRRLWSMLAHGQSDPLNAARLAAGLGISGNAVRRYLDVLTDLFMVRQLPPWSGNSRKRLVRAPRVYVRDSGLVHVLATVPDRETLLGHPLCGPSWEGFVIESLLGRMPDTWCASYYRTSAGAELDLVLEGPGGDTIAVEIKRSLAPKVGRGFHLAMEDVGASRGVFVMPRGERYPLGPGIEAVGLSDALGTWPPG